MYNIKNKNKNKGLIKCYLQSVVSFSYIVFISRRIINAVLDNIRVRETINIIKGELS